MIKQKIKLFLIIPAALLLSFFFFINARAYDRVVIVIDPGHGGENLDEGSESGAIYREEILERDVDLITATAMRDELLNYPNVSVYMTREDNRAIPLGDRVDFAKSVDADIMISVHYNASEKHKFYGAEIFTSAFSNYYSTGQSAASCIMEKWKEYGLYDKGIKTRIGSSGFDYYGVIRHGVEKDVPVIIIEHGYLDNDRDFERIGNETAWKELGVLDAQGIAAYYGLKKNVMSENIKPTVTKETPEDRVDPDDTPPSDVSVVIDRYDPATDSIDYSVYASEEESGLMYFGVTYDGEVESVDDEDFNELYLWDPEKEKMEGNLVLPADLAENLIFRVYNQYCLCTDFEVRKDVIDIAKQKALETPVILTEPGPETDSADTEEKSESEVKITDPAENKNDINVKGSITVQNNSSENENMVLYLLIFVLVIIAIVIFFVIIILIKKML
ncbi:MAG: N-acetylmuramoyl-L-alanine amidase [Lachnospiraceae bacterium]|nr:N-acetylmuramoyl-L-alanine amidase [Lachnospiraceae bacterium]